MHIIVHMCFGGGSSSSKRNMCILQIYNLPYLVNHELW